ncbi:MAG: helix-hairpin-helix domain-containing protein [Oscillospiraceae bacterium]|nr:helix-hairpin-helix domain-containing protein [Oscillospiraceae bacterium]
MKNRKAEIAAALITAVFVSFTLGYFLGRRASPSGVTVRESPAAGSVAATAPPVPSAESGDAGEESAPPAPASDPASEPHRDAEGRLRINLATDEELQELPGIGPAIAGRIRAYIEANGPLKRTATLKNVSGIGDKKYDAIKDLITAD